eukprot:5126143-Pleurochrysis_carterae.AAC.3
MVEGCGADALSNEITSPWVTLFGVGQRGGHMWRGCVIPFNVDSSAFQRSALKSWCRAERLASQVRQLLVLQLKFDCVLEVNWISTVDNVFADALSRQDGHQQLLDQSVREFLSRGVLSRYLSGRRCCGIPFPGPFVDLGRNALQTILEMGPQGGECTVL